eukprot:TRINITY_DN18196_c0_g1_i1.p1 TRINITY_DN18196_c0_g1~~TRINITY_DN18196_c0_g1_i1.p1  ORF type:complete len:349 (-),score=74.91 TRINITY_DN18196_c0_g1_i1:59-1006(-)
MKGFILAILLVAFVASAYCANVTAPYRTFNLNNKNNVIGYWGQGSGGDPALRGVCDNNSYDVIIISFITQIGNYRTPKLSSDYFTGADVDYCHSKGRTMMISVGGGGTSVSFVSVDDAENGATQVWNLFLGGNHGNRPYGSTIFDGIDLDIESGTPKYWAQFTNKLKSLMDGDNRQRYYLSAAPQCPFSDAQMGPDGKVWNGQPISGSTITVGWLDFINIQFYNNPGCQVNQGGFNLGTWSRALSSNVSRNRNMKIAVGLPASSSAAGSGYVDPNNLPIGTFKSFPSFIGIMFWDIQAAQHNNNFENRIKQRLNS